MKKIIKLNENDLRRIVKNAIKENFYFGTKSETLKEIERKFLEPMDSLIRKYDSSIEDLAYDLEDYIHSHKDEIESDEFYENEYDDLLEIANMGQNGSPLYGKICQL